MNAKLFLRQLRKLDRMIENKLIEKDQWKNIASGTSSPALGEKVQTSSNPQKMADAVCKYIDMEYEIDKYIDTLVDAKNDVINVIEQLDATEYDILHKRYVQYLELVDIADMYGKTYSWVTTVHGRALQNVQTILDQREGK